MRAALALLATLALCACAGQETTTPTNLVWDQNTQARVITSVRRQTQCIAPVSVFEINGQTTQVGPEFFLSPGRNTLKAFADVNSTGCPVLTLPPNYRIPALEAEFEAGVTYWIGLDHRAARAREWRFVVWRQEVGTGEDP